MKRILAVLGVLALLGTLAVLAAPTSSAQSTDHLTDGGVVDVDNENPGGGASIDVTIKCNDGENAASRTIAADDKYRFDHLVEDLGCVYMTLTAVQNPNTCTLYSEYGSWGGGIHTNEADSRAAGGKVGGNTLSIDFLDDSGYWIDFFSSYECVQGEVELYLDKDVSDVDEAVRQLQPFVFNITNPDENCTADQTVTLEGGLDGVDHDDDEALIPVIDGYIVGNKIVPCVYTVTETVPVGWTLVDIMIDGYYDDYCANIDVAKASIKLDAWCYGDAALEFYNELDPIPLIVTKTFTGRTEYSTTDRADFHIFSPGNCSGIPIDPFGNLLGSTGYFRTVNASQDTQYVVAPYGITDALPSIDILAADFGLGGDVVKCTYRVQETHAPDGCTPLDNTGSNADGPYWEQTWDLGVTSMEFDIVNDCTEPVDPVDPVKPVDPKKPVAPKPGAKAPSSGGSTAPKFTG